MDGATRVMTGGWAMLNEAERRLAEDAADIAAFEAS
jgi:hypothetical protein